MTYIETTLRTFFNHTDRRLWRGGGSRGAIAPIPECAPEEDLARHGNDADRRRARDGDTGLVDAAGKDIDADLTNHHNSNHKAEHDEPIQTKYSN